jgi:peptide/nickel transport system substrate-binding protein
MPVSRRELLFTTALGGLTAAGLAACSSGASGPATAATPTGPPRRGGHFVHGIAGGGNTDTLSAFQIFSVADYGRQMAQYDTLFYPSRTYTIENRLAQEYSVNATADEWTIRLRPGVEFSNGKTLDADDVLFTLRKTLDPATSAAAAGILSIVDPANSAKLDPLTVRIKLTRGAVNLPEMLSAMFVVPADYTEAKPVGSGPYVARNFQPGIRTDLVRNDNYWQSGKPYFDELTVMDFNDESARVNALISGQISGADSVDFSLVRLLNGRSNVTYLKQQTQSFVPLQMRTDQPPFDDVRVRQAFRLLVDRTAINEGAFLGNARPGNDIYGITDPAYDGALPQRVQDLDQARYLLKQAGAENLAVTLTATDMGAGVLSLCQVFAAQAKQAGVDVTVGKVDSATFNGPNLGSYAFSPNLLSPGSFLYTAQQLDAPVSTTNYTHFKDAEFDALYYQACAATNPNTRADLIHRMQKIQYDRGGLIITGFYDGFDGHVTKLGGLSPDISGTALYRYADLWFSS